MDEHWFPFPQGAPDHAVVLDRSDRFGTVAEDATAADYFEEVLVAEADPAAVGAEDPYDRVEPRVEYGLEVE